MTDSPDDPDRVGSARPASLDRDFEPVTCWAFTHQIADMLECDEAEVVVGRIPESQEQETQCVLLPLHRYNELAEKAAKYDSL